ncbi:MULTISPECIES: hypothetical protein [Arthrobacter]|nr:hypothetical protein [Arthrobacter psychrochitiniphilus]NYG17928.1 alkylhydroperoxidase/carboxymuconolactone decarboxylase family protein YurZ [Arthrobacter psychrochitiniphilus]
MIFLLHLTVPVLLALLLAAAAPLLRRRARETLRPSLPPRERSLTAIGMVLALGTMITYQSWTISP